MSNYHKNNKQIEKIIKDSMQIGICINPECYSIRLCDNNKYYFTSDYNHGLLFKKNPRAKFILISTKGNRIYFAYENASGTLCDKCFDGYEERRKEMKG